MLRFERPFAVYDGDCGFCERCVAVLAALAPGVSFVPSEGLSHDDRLELGLEAEALEKALHVVTAAGAVLAGADAVNYLLRRNSRLRAPLAVVGGVPFLVRFERVAYAFIARHRTFISRLLFAPACGVGRVYAKPPSVFLKERNYRES